MKKVKILVVLALTGVLFYSCDNQMKKENDALKAEVAMLAEQNAKLAMGNYDMEHSIEQYQATLQEIEVQLSAIDEKHELVKNKSAEFQNDSQTEEEILLHISHLHQQMENSKHKIAIMNNNIQELRKQNTDQHEELHKLDLYVNKLANLVVKKDNEIILMHGQLKNQNLAIGALSEAYAEQAMYNEVLLEIVNTAFFVAGTRKELIDMGVIDMEGGFIGIGRVKTLNANAPVQFLTPIDIRTTDIIELTGKKAELITTHAPESYEFTFDKESDLALLGIANKLKFWQETNYLVVEIVN